MTTKSQPIRIERPLNQLPRPASGNLLSQSLGAYPHQKSSMMRHISDISTITYSGYLLKRSNRPAPREAPFLPLNTAEGSIIPTPSPSLKPKFEHETPDFVVLKDHLEQRETNHKQEPKETENDESPLSFQQTLEFAAAFFGIDKSLFLPKPSEPTCTEPTPARSQPIQVRLPSSEPASRVNINSARPSRAPAVNWHKSSSDLACSTSILADVPPDVIDNDGFLWRAKYCVLESGILYFYRHQTDAEAPEAHSERQQYSLRVCSDDDGPPTPLSLAYSPIPCLRTIIAMEEVDQQSGRRWEKCVALSSVGAVRSAESEYGTNSFELSAVDDPEPKLILRAANAEEMNEWLFQFHRSIASYVLDIMECATASSVLVGDLASSFTPKSALPTSIDVSPDRNLTVGAFAFSPRLRTSMLTPSLSHGHGRSSLHRRRMELSSSHHHPLQSTSVDTSPEPHFPLFPAHDPQPSRFVTPTPRVERNALEAVSPEICAPQSHYPETERPPPAPTGRYVPPHLRKNRSTEASPKETKKYVPPHLRSQSSTTKYVPPQLRNRTPQATDKYISRQVRHDFGSSYADKACVEWKSSPATMVDDELPEFCSVAPFDEPAFSSDFKCNSFKLGGCADPSQVIGSILDPMYIPLKASRLGKAQSTPFGCFSNESSQARLRWEIGAVSECGVRESNEDSYLIVSDMVQALQDCGGVTNFTSVWNRPEAQHAPSLFALFDGHCGDQAARFSAERLIPSIHHETISGAGNVDRSESLQNRGASHVEQILRNAIHRLDHEFCDFSVSEGREWESGATALIAALIDEHLVIANLGDARGVVCRTIGDREVLNDLIGDGWNQLPSDDYSGSGFCIWKEVNDVHSPARADEKARIENANGWITTEVEIPIGQLKRMVLFDQDVVDILKRCFADRFQASPKAAAPQRILQISRVCGELAVSRAIGDRDFKAAHNVRNIAGRTSPSVDHSSTEWDNASLFLPFPADHSRSFVGDLVSNDPDFQTLRIGERGVFDEFLLLACDGLWDVMDADDAIRVTRDLLFEKQWPAKRTAIRLAELAVHLGSSDNITVIVVRFFGHK